MPYLYGVVAQLVECLVRIQEVVGSTPISSTIEILSEPRWFGFGASRSTRKGIASVSMRCLFIVK